MARFEYKPDAARELKRSVQMLVLEQQIGRRVADLAKRHIRMAEYRRTLAVKGRVEDGEQVVRVGTDWSFAHLDEFGSVNNTPSRGLTKAAEQFGLKVQSKGRS